MLNSFKWGQILGKYRHWGYYFWLVLCLPSFVLHQCSPLTCISECGTTPTPSWACFEGSIWPFDGGTGKNYHLRWPDLSNSMPISQDLGIDFVFAALNEFVIWLIGRLPNALALVPGLQQPIQSKVVATPRDRNFPPEIISLYISLYQKGLY